MNKPSKPLMRRLTAFSRKLLAPAFKPAKPAPSPAPVPSSVESVRFREATGIVGRVDVFGPKQIKGWAFRPERPKEPLVLAFYDGERFVCSATADLDRPDLIEKGRVKGPSGFKLRVPDVLRDGKPHKVDIRIAGTSESLLSAPIVVRPPVAAKSESGGEKKTPKSPKPEAVHAEKTAAAAKAAGVAKPAADEKPKAAPAPAEKPKAPKASAEPKPGSDTPTAVAKPAAAARKPAPAAPGPRVANPFLSPVAVGASRKAIPRSPDYLANPAELTRLQQSLATRRAVEGEAALAAAEPLARRLRREHALCQAAAAGQDVSAGTLVLLAAEGDGTGVGKSLEHWMLQSHPLIDALIIASDPANLAAEPAETIRGDQVKPLRAALSAAAWCVFARPGELVDPSTAALLNRIPVSTDVVLWSLLSSSQSVGVQGGSLHRRPDYDPHTIRHNPSIDSAFAVRGSALKDCPADVILALGAGRCHPLLFWLSAKPDLSWHTHAGVLTVRPGLPRSLDQRADTERDEAAYQRLAQDLIKSFDLRETRSDLPVPFLLVPQRRAKKISVVVVAEKSAPLLRCLNAIARQRTTGDVEVVVVGDAAVADAGSLVDKSRQIFGADIVRFVDGGAAANDSAQVNKGVAAAEGDVAVVCRSDLTFEDSTVLEEIAAWSLQQGIGTVACGFREARSGDGLYGYAVALPSPNPFAPVLVPNTDESYAMNVRSAAGNTRVLMAIEPSKFWAVGGFDEVRFPAQQNDVEFMLRCARHGLTHLYLGHLRARLTGSPSAPGPSGEPEDDGLELTLARALYPEASARASLQMKVERVQPSSGSVGPYQPDDIELLASNAIERTKWDDDRRQRIIDSAIEVTRAANQLAAAVSSLQATGVAD